MIVVRLALQSLRNRWLTAALTVFAIAISLSWVSTRQITAQPISIPAFFFTNHMKYGLAGDAPRINPNTA